MKIFDNRITIFNPGKLYGNITIEDLGCDVFLLIEKLQLKNVHIVAWSMGAMAIWCAFQNYQNENMNTETIP